MLEARIGHSNDLSMIISHPLYSLNRLRHVLHRDRDQDEALTFSLSVEKSCLDTFATVAQKFSKRLSPFRRAALITAHDRFVDAELFSMRAQRPLSAEVRSGAKQMIDLSIEPLFSDRSAVKEAWAHLYATFMQSSSEDIRAHAVASLNKLTLIQQSAILTAFASHHSKFRILKAQDLHRSEALGLIDKGQFNSGELIRIIDVLDRELNEETVDYQSTVVRSFASILRCFELFYGELRQTEKTAPIKERLKNSRFKQAVLLNDTATPI